MGSNFPPAFPQNKHYRLSGSVYFFREYLTRPRLGEIKFVSDSLIYTTLRIPL